MSEVRRAIGACPLACLWNVVGRTPVMMRLRCQKRCVVARISDSYTPYECPSVIDWRAVHVGQDDHTTRRATLCSELSAEVREYLTETDLLLKDLYETHSRSVSKASFLRKCLDTAGIDTLFEEACCELGR